MRIQKKSINEEIIYVHRYYMEPANQSFLYYKDHYLAQHSLFLGNKYGYNAFTRDSPPYVCVSSIVALDRYRLVTELDCKYKQRRETAAKENAGEGIAARI